MSDFSYLPYQHIAGVDEAGRGPLAGAVVSAAVILNPRRPIVGLADSKQLSEKRRLQLAAQIKADALAFSIAQADVNEIDRLNILHATLLAMQRAIAGLAITPDYVLIDGDRCPDLPMPARAIVQGDRLIESISAASILAKVTRDEQMYQLDRQHPAYGFARHKGYPTAGHLLMLARHGALDSHRRSFAPVRRARQAAEKPSPPATATHHTRPGQTNHE